MTRHNKFAEDSEQMCFVIPKTVKADLRGVARSRSLTLSDAVRMAVVEWIERNRCDENERA